MKSEGKDARAKQRWWSGWSGELLIGLGQLFFGIVLTGMVFYVVAQYKMGSFQSFELATVAGLLGGFPLLAAFGDKVTNEGLRRRLLAIGGLYLFAAIFFVVFGFYQAADQAKIISQTGAGAQIFRVVYVVTFYGGGIALVLAMWITLAIVPELVGLRSVKDRFKEVFRRNK